MADFEALIRNALASQDDGSSEVRAAIYQSSRNALQRILSSNRGLTVEAAMVQQERLEKCIADVEYEYTAPPPPAPSPPAPPEQPIVGPEDGYFVGEDDPLYEIQQILTGGKTPGQVASHNADHSEQLTAERAQSPSMEHSLRAEPSFEQASIPQPSTADPAYVDPTYEAQRDAQFSEPESVAPHAPSADGRSAQLHEDDFVAERTLPTGFAARRKKQRNGLWVLLTIGIFIALGWIGYTIYTGLLDGSLIGLNKASNSNRNAVTNDINSQDYITILTPNDLSSLVVAGRGDATLVTQQNTQMIRIQSQRDKDNREQAAEPILLRLKPGVLERVENKRLTVEIFAKSGTDQQAQFSVSCQFTNGSDCGRKRFVTGVQPQASIFGFDFGNVTDTNRDYFIELKTDTTANAAVTGEGDILDIVYVRVKATDE